MLEVTSEERGFCMRIFPAGGVDVYDLNLVSKTRVPGSTTGVDRRSNFDAFDSMAMMRRLSEAFSQIAEIDGRFPWSTTSPSVMSRLRFALSRASATASPELVSMSGRQLQLQNSSRSVRQRSVVTFVGSARPLSPDSAPILSVYVSRSMGHRSKPRTGRSVVSFRRAATAVAFVVQGPSGLLQSRPHCVPQKQQRDRTCCSAGNARDVFRPPAASGA